MLKSIKSIFTSRSFMVSCLTFKYLIHFELIFLWCKKVFQLHSFACSSPVFPTPFIEKTVLSPLYILGFLCCRFSSVQFSSVTHLCPTLCNPMNRSTPGLPVHHQLPESTQTHVHRVGDAIQPSHPLSSPYPPALNLSQHQGLFQ